MSDLMEYRSVQYERAVIVENDKGELIRTHFLEKGQHIRWIDRDFEDVTPEKLPNATIEKCYGDVYSTKIKMDIIKNDFKTHTIIIKWQ